MCPNILPYQLIALGIDHRSQCGSNEAVQTLLLYWKFMRYYPSVLSRLQESVRLCNDHVVVREGYESSSSAPCWTAHILWNPQAAFTKARVMQAPQQLWFAWADEIPSCKSSLAAYLQPLASLFRWICVANLYMMLETPFLSIAITKAID